MTVFKPENPGPPNPYDNDPFRNCPCGMAFTGDLRYYLAKALISHARRAARRGQARRSR